LVEQPSDIGIDQNDARIGELGARSPGDRLDVAIQAVPERCGNTQPFATQRLRLGHRGSRDHGIEQRDVGDGAAHRTDGIAGVADWNHQIGIVITPLRAAVADRWAQTDGAGQCRRHPGRTAGIRSQSAADNARRDRCRRSTRRTAGNPALVIGIFHRTGE